MKKKIADIELDKNTQMDLTELSRVINELKVRVQTIVTIYVRASGGKGSYSISKDVTKLEAVE